MSHAPRPRIPPFHPVPLRARRDGWTPHAQAAFVGWLAQTGSVRAAAERVGLSRESAYRLRRRPGAEGFAAAWDAALGNAGVTRAAPKVTLSTLQWRARRGFVRPLVRRGRFVRVVERPDNSALLRLLAWYDRMLAAPGGASPGPNHRQATKMRRWCQPPCPRPWLPPI